jgi:acetyltransferase
VALVGIPGDLTSPLARPLTALRRFGFAGRIFPVNPKYAELDGLPCFPGLRELPEPVEMAWISVPAVRVMAVLEECIALKIRFLVVVTAGFAETGTEGALSQSDLSRRARDAGITLLGPNSIGFVNAWDRVPLSFSGALELPEIFPGPLAIVSQSGGLGGSLLNRVQDRRLGVSYMISTGNEAGITLADCLEFLVEDERTRAIVLIVEQVRDGERFRAAAGRALERGKPIIALKLGASEAAGRLALSHTGALVGSHRAWEAMARQLGLILAEDLTDLPDLAAWSLRTPPVSGNRVGVVTSSGGAAVQMADQIERHGLRLSPLDRETAERLTRILPAYATVANPLDITAGLPEATFAEALRTFVASPEFDALLIPMTMLVGEPVRERVATITRVAGGLSRPLAVAWLGGSLAEEGGRLLNEAGVACFTSSANMVRALRSAWKWTNARAAWLTRQPVTATPIQVRGRGVMSYIEGCALLERFRIPLPSQRLVRSASEALSAAREINAPVALKLVGPDFAHKSDAGALYLHLKSQREIRDAAKGLLNVAKGRAWEGFLVQEMVEGLEAMVGVTRDPAFGPFLLVGPGGIHAEILPGHACRPLPVSREEVEAMVDEVPAFRLLSGHRGVPPKDRRALVEAILGVARLASALGDQLGELDLNPLVVQDVGQGVRAVDALVVLRAT